jgi:hypothetical protein
MFMAAYGLNHWLDFPLMVAGVIVAESGRGPQGEAE